MRTLMRCLVLLVALASHAEQTPIVTEYRNAVWWDGISERHESMFVEGDRFLDTTGVQPDRIVDLLGALATAPFAEGHNHNVVASIFERSNAEYLRDGVFYVKAPTTYPPAVAAIREELNRPDAIDATFSMGSITSPGGHPVGLFVNTLSSSIYGSATYEDLAGQAFHEVATNAGAVNAVRRIAEQGADFVKVMLLYSEDYEGTDEKTQKLGLRPDLLPVVVKEAHDRGLTVTLHATSAHDFRAGLNAGVDEFAHLPGVGWKQDRDAEAHRITAADAEKAKAIGAAVVTTTFVIAERFRSQPERLKEFDAMQRHNLDLLKAAGVEIRIGSDTYDREGTGAGAHPTRGEVENLVRLGAYDARTVLALWIDTGRKIFPGRRIACFEPGCEASFLVFEADPRIDIANLSSMRAAIKQGQQVAGSFPVGGGSN